MKIAPARIAAFQILERVEEGAWASDLLHARTGELSQADAGLASAIVFGVLRRKAQLDWLIELYGGRKPRLDSAVRTTLRMGIFQLRWLDRVPAHAAVDESVELCKFARKRSATALVNALLHKTNRFPVAWPAREVAQSCPEWLLERWEKAYGVTESMAIAQAALEEPRKDVLLTAHGERRQDIGAQTVVPLLDLQPGQRFLDLCAAPGNKTAQALDAGVRVVACDIHLHRLRQMAELGVPMVALDATRPLPFATRFDRILVDAPCSGTGTLGRNPEIKWRLTPADIEELAAKQRAILENALTWLAPGGKLVYATCSLEREENEGVLETLGRTPARVLQRVPGRDPGDGFWAAVLES